MTHEWETDDFLDRLTDPAAAAAWKAQLEALRRAVDAADELDTIEQANSARQPAMPPFDDDELLSLYLEAELAGQDAAALYPEFAALLAHDPALAEDYAALRRALLEAAATDLKEATGLPYAAPAGPVQEDAHWSTRVLTRLAGGPLRLLFTPRPAFWVWLRGPAWGEVAVRGESEVGGEPFLLLAQTVSIGADDLLAELSAVRLGPTPGALPGAEGDLVRLHLFAALAPFSPQSPLPIGTRVLLTWGDEAHAAVLGPDGRAALGEVTLPAPATAEAALPRLELAFDIPA